MFATIGGYKGLVPPKQWYQPTINFRELSSRVDIHYLHIDPMTKTIIFRTSYSKCTCTARIVISSSWLGKLHGSIEQNVGGR